MLKTTAQLSALPVKDVIARVGVNKAMSYKSVGALIFTYRCSISCPHCLFACGPRVQSPPMSVEDGLQYLHQLHQLDRVVHIAGGEAFLYWDTLSALIQAAGREGVAPHFVETNSSWAANDNLVRERFRLLRDCGVLGMYFSADPFHFLSVPPQNYFRARAIACEIFDPLHISGHVATKEQADELAQIARDPERFAAYVRSHPPKIVGNAAARLAQYFPDLPIESLDLRPGTNSSFAEGCYRAAVPPTVWEVHIDPYGNVQTNCGIILGNARRTPVLEVLKRGVDGANPIVFVVAKDGPRGLLELATRKGCPKIPHAKSKCHLCFMVRTFLRPHFPDILGPDEVYSPSSTVTSNPV
jgi:hypothetical protein